MRVLPRLLQALSLSLALALCTSTAQAEAADAPLPDPLAAGWQGAAVCEKLHEDEYQRILRCTFPPGVGHERHFHPRHFGYALSGGTMRITDAKGTRDAELASGSYFSSDGVDWHVGLNVGDTTVTYLMIEPKSH